MITSRKNSQLKTILRLRRSKGDSALLEGPHLIKEALASRLELNMLLATQDFLDSDQGLQLERYLPFAPLLIKPSLLAEITDSDSPRGIVAMTRIERPKTVDLALTRNAVLVYAELLQDPGNEGAVVRSAEASGASAVCLGPGSANPNHPRALRASAGSLLRLPVVPGCEAVELTSHLAPIEPYWLALTTRGGQNLFETELNGCLILAVGAEGQGLSDQAKQLADCELTIPLRPPVESLNVAAATAVALFEIARRRV